MMALAVVASSLPWEVSASLIGDIGTNPAWTTTENSAPTDDDTPAGTPSEADCACLCPMGAGAATQADVLPPSGPGATPPTDLDLGVPPSTLHSTDHSFRLFHPPRIR